MKNVLQIGRRPGARWIAPVLAAGALLVIGLAGSAAWSARRSGARPQAVRAERVERAGEGRSPLSQSLPLIRDDGRGEPESWSWGRLALLVATGAVLLGGVALRGAGRGREMAAGMRGWLGSLQRGKDSTALHVVSAARLTNRATVHVVSWKGSEWLLGCADGEITVIGRSTPEEPAVEPGRCAGTTPGEEEP